MLAILNSLNAHSFPIFQPILMRLVSKFMVYRALSDKTYLSLGLLSPIRAFPIAAYPVCISYSKLFFSKHKRVPPFIWASTRENLS